MRYSPLFGALAALSVATMASAAPYGGAPVSATPVHVVGDRAFELHQPDLVLTASGPVLHGAVCRTAGTLGEGGGRIEVRRADGGAAAVGVVDGLGPRGRACGFYSIALPWRDDARALEVRFARP